MKIYANAHFGLREDTLENWITNNPVLEKGEPAVVRDGENGEWLKIGDGATSFSDLPWKKGPKGDKGEKGDKGDKGDNGDAYELPIVDQTYNPTSENAQSGIAVAEAIANLSNKKVFEKIATITVVPDTDGTLPTNIIISTDDNGQPFELTDIYCNIKAGMTVASNVQVLANNAFLISNCNAGFATNLRNWYFRFVSYGENNGGLFSAPNQTMGSVFPNANLGNGINLATPINIITLNKISKVAVNIFTSNSQWIEGSTFELWGVRA